MTFLLVISPSPAKQQLDSKDSLHSLLAYGPGYHGLLTVSTRRDFVVANTDIAPTILSYLGIQDHGIHMIGQPVTAKPANGPMPWMRPRPFLPPTALTNRLRSPPGQGLRDLPDNCYCCGPCFCWLFLGRHSSGLPLLVLVMGVASGAAPHWET